MVTSVSDAQEIDAVMTIKRIDASDSNAFITTVRPKLFSQLGLLIAVWHSIVRIGRFDERTSEPARSSDRKNELAMSLGKDWRLAGSQGGVLGQEQFVLVRKASESDRQIYDDAIKHLCRLEKWCGLHFLV